MIRGRHLGIPALFLSVVLLFAAGSTAVCGESNSSAEDNTDDYSGEYYDIECKIVDKAKLPPEKLADAIAAKGLITDRAKLLEKAASTMPDDPRYPYLLAVTNIPVMVDSDQCNAEYRAHLERALAADPDYLPALYAYATTKPTHEQRMQALLDLAERDQENAKPYYVMAVEEYKHLVQDRKTLAETDREAIRMDSEEWQKVLQYIRKGNERSVFSARMVCAPSVDDIAVATGGKTWPRETARKVVSAGIIADQSAAGPDGAPFAFAFSAVARELALQAKWEAKKAAENGNTDDALDMLHTIRAFADRYAHAEPEQMIPFLVAKAVRDITGEQEEKIARDVGDDERVQLLEKECRIWKDASSNLLEVFQKNVQLTTDIPISPTECLELSDVEAEQEAMKKLLKDVRVFP